MIFCYEKVFGFTLQGNEMILIHELLTKPKSSKSRKAAHIDELTARDLSIVLETFRYSCDSWNYDADVVLTYYDKVFAIFEKDKTEINLRILSSLVKTAMRCRMDQDEVFAKLTQLIMERLTPDVVLKEQSFCSFVLSDLAKIQ